MLVSWASEGFFPGGVAVGDFPKIFPGGPKVVKIKFYPSKLKKQTFLLIISKSGGPRLPLPHPADAHGWCLIFTINVAEQRYVFERGTDRVMFMCAHVYDAALCGNTIRNVAVGL